MRLILIKIFMLTLSLILISLIPHINVYADAPYLTKVGYYYLPQLIDSNPHGRLNLYVVIYRLMNDGNPNYDWYYYFIQIQTVPGKVAYNSDWVTADHTAEHTLASFDAGTNNWFVDYGPTTFYGYYSASTSVIVRLTAGYIFTYKYDISYVKVIDLSDYSQYRIKWIHDFNEQGAPPGSSPDSIYNAKPSFVVLAKYVSMCDGVLGYCWSGTFAHVVASYRVTFGHQLCWLGIWCWWEYKTFDSGVLYLYVSTSY